MLEACAIEKHYFRKSGSANFFRAVEKTDLRLERGTITMLTGRSGSGKTTLLQMLSGLLTPTKGTVRLDDTELYTQTDERLAALRARRIAVIPQVNAAVPSLTVSENILFPGLLSGADPEKARQRAEAMLERLGIAALKDEYPDALSGGEKRRMSIIRALVGEADIILADEPTGDLDDENTEIVLAMLKEAAGEGRTVLLVTHEQRIAAWADRVLRMDAGRIIVPGAAVPSEGASA